MTTLINQSIIDFWTYIDPSGGDVIECRFVRHNDKSDILVGYYNEVDALARDVSAYDGEYHVLAGIQPRPMGFLARSPNKVTKGALAAYGDDIQAVYTIVIDIDTVRGKNMPSTDAELAEALRVADAICEDLVSQGFERPVRVCSGNGYHLYMALFLHLIEHRGIKTKLKDFEATIKAKFSTPKVKIDKISDLPRMIRIPGSMNNKGDSTPDRPHRQCQPLDPMERREDDNLMAYILSLDVSEEPEPQATPGVDAGPQGGPALYTPGEGLSDEVRDLLNSDNKLNKLFNGQGKTAIGPNGRQDKTTSGYDHSFLLELIKHGISDPQVLGDAIWHRPLSNAQDKRTEYVPRTVTAALKSSARKPLFDKQDDLGFNVDEVIKYDCVPPIYELRIDNRILKFNAKDLLSKKRFKTSFFAVIGRVPKLPSGRGSDDVWDDLVNSWVANATVVEMPDEANEDAYLRMELVRILSTLPEGEEPDDLDEGRYIKFENQKVFQLSAVVAQIEERVGKIGTSGLAVHLKKLGCKPSRPRIDGEQKRIWTVPDDLTADWVTDAPSSNKGVDAEPKAARDVHEAGLKPPVYYEPSDSGWDLVDGVNKPLAVPPVSSAVPPPLPPDCELNG